MGYTPTTWQSGDVITSTKLNKLEQGVSNSVTGMVVNWDSSNNVLDKTYAEIHDAFAAGTLVRIKYSYGSQQYSYDEHYGVVTDMYSYMNNYFKIMVSRVRRTSINISGTMTYDLGVPCAMIFKATGASSYPTFEKSIYPLDYVSVTTDFG